MGVEERQIGVCSMQRRLCMKDLRETALMPGARCLWAPAQTMGQAARAAEPGRARI